MPLFLRFIKSNKISTWEECKKLLSPIPGDDVPADILGEFFPIQKNQLSVYQVEDNRSNLDPILAAFAANRRLQPICFVLFDPQILSDLGINICQAPGTLKDEAVNGVHFNLTLSGKKLVGLARNLLVKGEVDTRDTKEVAELVKRSCDNGRFRWNDLDSGLRKGIEKELRS